MAARQKKTRLTVDNRPISSKELKYWLSGILEFQPDNWVPTAVQWNGIKNKIFNLIDVVEVNNEQSNKNMIQSSQPQPFTSQHQGGLVAPVTSNFPQLSTEEFERKLKAAKQNESFTGLDTDAGFTSEYPSFV